jgi:hypothetical protein
MFKQVKKVEVPVNTHNIEKAIRLLETAARFNRNVEIFHVFVNRKGQRAVYTFSGDSRRYMPTPTERIKEAQFFARQMGELRGTLEIRISPRKIVKENV